MSTEPSSDQDPTKSESKPSDETTSTSTTEKTEAELTTPESTPSFGGWFTSMVQSAKDTVSKSAGSTFENIKRDLSELKDAVQSDATSMVYSTASIVKNKLNEIGNTVNEIGSLGTDEIEPDGEELMQADSRKASGEPSTSSSEPRKQSSVSKDETEDESEQQSPFNLETINTWTNLLTDRAKSTISMVKDTLVDSIFINRDFLIDELNEEPYVIKDGQVVPISNWKELLHSLQTNPDTYCREPSGPPEEFDLWLTKFNLINYQKQMEYLLDTVPEILKLHINLVPKELSDSDFWHRYYYRVHQLREEQKRLILSAEDGAVAKESTTESNSVNIKYLSEKSSASDTTSRADTESKISRSSTEDWEKMDEKVVDKSSRSSDESDRDWVKCD